MIQFNMKKVFSAVNSDQVRKSLGSEVYLLLLDAVRFALSLVTQTTR